MLLIRKPWDSQPQGVVGTDKSVRGLVSLYNGATNTIDVQGTVYPLTYGSAGSRRAFPGGLGAYFPASISATMTLPTGALTNGIFTRLALVNWVSGRSTISSNDQVNSCAIEILSTGALNLTREDSADAVTSATGVVVNGETFVFGASWDGTTARIYKNGVLLASSAYATGFAATNPPKFGVHVGSVYLMNGTIIAHADFNVALSNSEASEYSQQIWKLFAPRSIWVPVSASGGGTTYTITPSGGITLAGTSVDIKGKIFLPTGGVSFAGTGGATFASGGTTYTISPTGGLTFGGTATQVRSKTITPSGGLTLSGTGLGLRTKVFSAAGGVSLSGTGSMTSNTTVGSTQTGERTKVGVGT